MKLLGVIFLITGLSLGVYSFLMDTTVTVNYSMGNPFNLPTTIKNIGLMNDQRNYLIASGFITSFGVLLIIVSYFIPNEKQIKYIHYTSNNENSNPTDFQKWKASNPHKSIHDYFKENSK